MAIDAFLEIKDESGVIKGECKDDSHKELIQITNFSFGCEIQASAETGTGLIEGKAIFKTFSFDVACSKASPNLFKACFSGAHCPSAVLYVRKAGGKPQDFYIWNFKELVLTNFECTGGDTIVEKISFAYTGLHCEYKPQKQDGTLDSGVKAGWDQKAGKNWAP